MAKISTQTSVLTAFYGEKKALEYIAQAGFDCVDFSLFKQFDDVALREKGSFTGMYAEPREKMLEHYRDIKRTADEYGIGFSQLHSPFPTLVPCKPEYDEIMIDVAKRSIEVTAVLDCPYIVIHPVCGSGLIDFMKVNMDFYGKLADTARENGVGICLENMYRLYRTGKLLDSACSSPADAIEMVDALNNKYGDVFSFCLDVGHAHVCGYDPADYVRKLGKRLTALHIHDTNSFEDSHTIPYLRDINWDSFFTALKEIDYKGTISFEADAFLERFPKEVVPEAVKLIYALGRYFSDKYEL